MTLLRYPLDILWGIPAFALCAGLVGCASGHVLPCEFDVHVKIDHEAAVGSACHDPLSSANHSDSGYPLTATSWVRGCSGEMGIVSVDEAGVLGHEMAHQVDRHCSSRHLGPGDSVQINAQ